MDPSLADMWRQVAWLLILPIPIASISWTVTHEEIFSELREYCSNRSQQCKRLVERKLFYVMTCEYCFSHWVALGAALLTGYRLLLPDWRGALIGYFALTAIANLYLSLYSRLRVDIKAERVQIAAVEDEISSSRDDSSGS